MMRNVTDKKLRAMALLQKTVYEGKSIKKASEELGIHPNTGEKELKWAREIDLFMEYRQKMFEELLPLSHQAVKMALEDGDAQVALKIFDNLGLGVQKSNAKAAKEEEEGFYEELRLMRQGTVINITQRQRELSAPFEAGTTGNAIPDGLPTGGVHRIALNSTPEGSNRADDVDEAIEVAANGGELNGS